MGWLTSGPATIEPNWPAAGNRGLPAPVLRLLDSRLEARLAARSRRAHAPPPSSGFPARVLNWLFYSRQVLYLPVLSLAAPPLPPPPVRGRAALERLARAAGRAAHWAATLVVGVPLAFLFMAVEYVRYFNTFYRDTGTIVFLLVFLAALALLDGPGRERRALVLCRRLPRLAGDGQGDQRLLALPGLSLPAAGPRGAAAGGGGERRLPVERDRSRSRSSAAPTCPRAS